MIDPLQLDIEQINQSEFEYVGGDLSIDFVNTISGRGGDNPTEYFFSYERLVEWASGAQIIDDAQASRLIAEARKRPQAAEEALMRAQTFRQSLYLILFKSVRDLQVEQGDLTILNQELQRGLGYQKLHAANSGYHLTWDLPGSELVSILWPVASSAAELLVSGNLGLLRVCDGDDCGWLFMDRSKNHSRRWCTMKDCGNVEKVRKYRGKHKKMTGS
ncbi:MAG: hypothetical protein EHM41_04420 [Chloroflexi bacterium]|nr:MAG: hypothetical protein EHM41_04420 [Chloroflexota bacterium]